MVTRRMPFERVLASALTLTGLVGVMACDRGRDKAAPSPPLPAPAASSATSVTGCTLPSIPTKVAVAPKRLVAIGDVHGDLAATKAALKAAGLINISDSWVGGDTVLVQTGDILDRGDDEDAILELFERLTAEAKAAGGMIVQLHGNHELMNTARDYRYVTPGAMSDFGGDRQKALDPGGPWAKKLAAFNIVAIVGDSVFSHAGVLGDWITQIDKMNLETRCWFDGQAGTHQQPPVALTSEDSPVWTRAYGEPGAADCAALSATLGKLGVKRMVVGHTPQRAGITSDCDGKLWRIDVGLAAHYGGVIEVLEITDAGPRVLKGTR